MKLKAGLLFFLALIVFAQSGFAQGKKTIRENKVESKTTLEYFIDEGRKEPVTESIEIFDARGNTIELKEYNSDGELKKWQLSTFDENDNKTEEKLLDEKGKQIERTVWKFQGELMVEKLYYDHKDRLVKRKVYKYEYTDK